MRNLTLLPKPPAYVERYADIRERKRNPTKAMLIGAHQFVSNRYDAYEAATAALALETLPIVPSAPDLKTALRACYSSTQRLEALLNAIRDTQPRGTSRFCFLCQTTTPGGWDHYLPAEMFPEFAVFAPNLVPCCSTCNSRKDDDWLNANGQRQYIHFGYDVIPNVQFLDVDLITNPASPAVGAKFSLHQAGMPQAEWDLISSHFSRLKLIKSYDDKANDEIDAALDSCRAHQRHNGQNVAGFLHEHAQREAGLFGRNHWRAVLLRAMAAHASLPQWVAARP